MSNTIHAFDYLADTKQYEAAALTVLFGDTPFLKGLALEAIEAEIVGEDSPFATFQNDPAWRDVNDELSTVSLFGGGGPRLVVVRDADDFVSNNRDRLEKFVKEPPRNSVLVLEVNTWASNTKLYKATDKTGLQIACKPPQKTRGKSVDEKAMLKWLRNWCSKQHQAKLSGEGAELLLELVGINFGLLDQELAKLALFAGVKGDITPEMVRDVVGGWKTKTIWELLDAAAEGDADEALLQLDRLIHAGEEPFGLFARMAWQLRRYADATRSYQLSHRTKSPLSLRDSLERAGFRKWPAEELANAERRLKQLGSVRAGALYSWLISADLAMKGSHSSPTRARHLLEMLIVRLSKQAALPS